MPLGSIDPMVELWMQSMFANVSLLFSFIDASVHANSFIHFLACTCSPYYHTGDCQDGNGECYCNERFQSPHCDKCAKGSVVSLIVTHKTIIGLLSSKVEFY